MALPLIATLNKAARAALPIIQKGVSEGISSRAISSIIKDAFGKSIRRSTLLDVMRALTGIERANATLKFIRKDRLPNIARIPEAITRIRRNFAFTVQVTGQIIDASMSFAEGITIASDVNLTRSQIEAKAMDALEQRGERYNVVVESVLLVSAVKAGALGTLSNPIRAL